jgi:hypothetical protein
MSPGLKYYLNNVLMQIYLIRWNSQQTIQEWIVIFCWLAMKILAVRNATVRKGNVTSKLRLVSCTESKPSGNLHILKPRLWLKLTNQLYLQQKCLNSTTQPLLLLMIPALKCFISKCLSLHSYSSTSNLHIMQPYNVKICAADSVFNKLPFNYTVREEE